MREPSEILATGAAWITDTELEWLCRQIASEREKHAYYESQLQAEIERLREALEAASEFEREYQRQRGAVLSSDDFLMLDELQTRFLRASEEPQR